MFNPYFPPRISYTDQEIKEIVSSSDIGIISIGRISGEGADRAVKDDFLISEIEKNMIFQVCEAYHKEKWLEDGEGKEPKSRFDMNTVIS